MRKKTRMILGVVFGFLIYSAMIIVANLCEMSRLLTGFCSLVRYGALIWMVFSVRYFGTTYLWEKNPDICRESIIEATDERNRLIEYRTKASVFDILFYMLLAVLFLLFDLKVEALAIGILIAVLAVTGICYAYYKNKYEKEL